MILTNELIYTVCFVLCFIGTQGKPSLSFNLHSFTMFNGFNSARNPRDVVKPYSGQRVQNDSLRMVYYYDQTIAIAELGPKKLLLNCELIEVYENEEALKALEKLKTICKPLKITFEQMNHLMLQCQQVDAMKNVTKPSTQVRSANNGKGFLASNPFTLFSGIIPGTKWCGTGDIAENYHDLGTDAGVDMCCRTHDLCPVKIKAYCSRYNLTNGSLYSKSHCVCDQNLYDCLKASDSPSAHLMGNVYFNLVQIPCVDDTKEGGRIFRAPRSNF